MDVRTDGDIADSFWWRRTTLTRRTPLYDACVSAGLLVAATIVGALLAHPGLASMCSPFSCAHSLPGVACIAC